MRGSEQLILEGGRKLLSERQPRVSVEVGERRSHAVASLLTSHGYELFDGDLPLTGQESHRNCAFHTLAIPSVQRKRLPAVAA